MKKTLSILLSIVMLLVSIVPFTAFASAINTAQTAETISLNQTVSTTFKYGYPTGNYGTSIFENAKYFKFTPSSTGYYEFNATGYENTVYVTGKTADVSISITDSNGNSIGSAYTNEYTLITRKALELKANQTYFIELTDYMSNIASYSEPECGYAEQTINLKVTVHKHIYDVEEYSSFNVYDCRYCDYYYYDYNVGTVGSVKLNKTSFAYNGKTQTPTVIAKNSYGETISSAAYTVSISGNKKNIGTNTVTVRFGSGYKNYTKKLTYQIVPKGTSVSKLTAGKKKFKVTWKKQTTQTTGYQIQYSLKKNMSSSKTVTVSKNKTTSKTISKLKGKKTYYVRVRTYKTVSGKKYYSSWSKVKSVKTK